MTLNTVTSIETLTKRSMEQIALDLIVALRQGYTNKTIKEYARRIGNMGASLP